MTGMLLNLALTLALAPLLTGLLNKTKAVFAGRRGASVFQLYYDLFKLLRKSSPRSLSSTWLFDLAPILSLAALLAATLVFPLGHTAALVAFSGDAVVFFYLLGTSRFFTVLGARDVASAFPDMGSAREVQFSSLIEAIVFAALAFLALMSRERTLTGFLSFTPGEEVAAAVPLLLAAAAMFVVLLAENCRVPFDDPETHLELTMIHEAMILDNSGPDLAFILYGASLKLWLFSAFCVRMLFPDPVVAFGFFPLTLLMGVVVGAVESSMARMRFLKTPFVLAGAFALAVLALVLEAMEK